jgi:2-dehydropantoate 2-reductase
MLQDVEAGRPLEVEALLGSVVEIAGLLGLELPHLQTVYACTKLLDATLRHA